ncbi:MAG: FAD-dependent oxidoreductase [Acidobacteriota bacterium]|nr:FAD-dependent oxidoreductase [Acidobacteriota bacterium]
MTGSFDIAVVGGGFAGSLFAMAAKRAGRSVVLIEKARHPRFAIGESTSPLANLLLAGLCDDWGLDRVRALATFGSWRREHPELDCGLKRGFTFFAHREGKRWSRSAARENELLVAASPNDEVADTHWLRAGVDQFLFAEAGREGVECLEETQVEKLDTRDGAGGWHLHSRRGGAARRIRARFVVDASGPRGFLQRALSLGERFDGLPRVEGLFTHFTNVARAGNLAGHSPSGSVDAPPYPPDDAAVHHVLEGGWVWVLRFGSGLVSAGVAATPALARAITLEEGAPAWERLLDRYPFLRAQFGDAVAAREFTFSSCLPFRAAAASGPGWAMLPSAAAFVDPLLSTGIPLALGGVRRLAAIVGREWGRAGFEQAVARAGRRCLLEADAAALLVAALYASLADFELFSSLTFLYFAAASFAEAATRLGRPAASRGFLLLDHPRFAPAFRQVCRRVLDAGRRGCLRAERGGIIASVFAAIEPVDVVGLATPGRRNWHPFDAEPLLASASKLGVRRREVAEMLARTTADCPSARILHIEVRS